MARSAVRSRFLSLRHTKIVQSDPKNLSIASLQIYVGDGLLTPDMSKSPFDPPSRTTQLVMLRTRYEGLVSMILLPGPTDPRHHRRRIRLWAGAHTRSR
jgi:hypothetical protein